MLKTEPSASASASPQADFGINAVSLKLPEFWTDNIQVQFAQTEAQFAIRGVTSSHIKLYYLVTALGRADSAQVVNLIEFPLHESLKECLTELHNLNPFPWYHCLLTSNPCSLYSEDHL